MLGDRLPRRPLLIACQLEQLAFSLVLAWLVTGQPSKTALFLVVMAIGVGNAVNAPTWSAMIPSLVPLRDLPGAISVNSTLLNGSRVIGPLVVVALRDTVGVTTAGVFVINAATYLFVVGALLVAHPGRAPADTERETFVERLTAGVREARRNPVVGRILIVLPLFSLLCLPYVGQFQTVAERNLGTDSDGSTYRWLYATWGLGACLGGLAIGTVLARTDKRVLPRTFLLGFAGALVVFAHLRHPWPAFPVGFALGFCYFAITTSMLTVLQQQIDSRVRARVMALWFVGFGGTVPIGAWLGGWLMDTWDTTHVLEVGALAAVALAGLASFKALDEARSPSAHPDLAGSAIAVAGGD